MKEDIPIKNYRFGQKIKLPSTVAIKHQVRMRMAQDEKKKEDEAKQQEDLKKKET